MFWKYLIIATLFLLAQFLIMWWGMAANKMSSKGIILGVSYENFWIGITLLQLKFLPLFLIINYLFATGLHFGYQVLPFIPLMLLWIASMPIATFLFNLLVLKEPLHWSVFVGAFFIFLGTFFLLAGKDFIGK